MAERKSSTQSTKVEEARKKVDQLTAEQQALSALDDPNDPEKGSPWRQTAYLVAVVVVGFVFNLLLLVIIAGS
jgi:hypothetical protein